MPEPIRCIDCGEIADQQGDGEYVCEACGLYFTDEDLSDDDSPEDDPLYFTWRALRDQISAMPPERLDDPVQLIAPSPNDDPIELAQAIDMNTIGYYSTCTRDDGTQYQIENYSRGVIDNKNHKEHYVLLTDHNPFDAEGNTFFRMTEEGMIGNKTGKNYGPSWLSQEERDEVKKWQAEKKKRHRAADELVRLNEEWGLYDITDGHNPLIKDQED